MKLEAQLVARALYAELADAIERHALMRARVEHKVNEQGALVVALIVPATLADPDRWRDEPTSMYQPPKRTKQQ